MAVLMGLFILAVIIFGGGAYVWLSKVRMAQQAALAERRAAERARMEAERAAEAERQLRETLEQAQTDTQSHDPLDASRQEQASSPAFDMVEVVPAERANQDLSITIDEDGNVALQGVTLPAEQIGDKLNELTETNPSGLTISIWADESCDFRHVAELVRRCRASGLARIQIAVRNADDPTSSP